MALTTFAFRLAYFPMKPTPRDYQRQDVDAIIAAHGSHHRVIGRAATGLGKAIELAMLAEHYAQFGRVIVMVDMTTLANQLVETIKWVTGNPAIVGIEAGEQRVLRHNNGTFWPQERIVVAMAQTLVSNDRYKDFPPETISAVLLDECEIYAPENASYRVPIDYWMNGNANAKLYGCTATPMRTDGVSMDHLFDHVAVDRDIVWAIENGWLVPAKQGWVQVSLDFSTLRTHKSPDGEDDYSEDEIAEKIKGNQHLIELAKGIRSVAEDRRTIVICPTKDTATELSQWINKEKIGSARAIFGTMTDTDKETTFADHRNGEFQFLISVMMLTKGYDDPQVSCVVNCRKTKSKRLYQQMLGRGTRPVAGLLDGHCTNSEWRKQAIANSSKPDMIIANMIGLEEQVTDMTVLDVLHGGEEKQVREYAAQLMHDNRLDETAALTQAKEWVEEEAEASLALAEVAGNKLEYMVSYEAWKRTEIDAKIVTQWDELGFSDRIMMPQDTKLANALNLLHKAGWTDKILSKLDRGSILEKARVTIARHKAGLATYKQCRILMKHGWNKEQVASLSKDSARTAIDNMMANWKH